MIRTVDLVIAGSGNGALAAAAAALHRGQRVLVVLRSRDARMGGQRVRRRLHKVANAHNGQLVVATNAAVVCVDGVDGVEVVVIRHARTGRLSAVNASAFLPCGGTGPLSPRPPPSTDFFGAA